MNTDFESKKYENQWKYTYDAPGRWVTAIIQLLTARITRYVTLAITVVVAILVILGGLILAYFYLPLNIFYIILSVLLADVGIGIVLRAVYSRR